MKLEQFKMQNPNKIFLVFLNTDQVDMLSFDSKNDLKHYVFTDSDSKQLLYHKMASLEHFQTLLQDASSDEVSVDEIEDFLHQHSDYLTLLDVICEGKNAIIIEADKLDEKYWTDLLNPSSYLYNGMKNPSLGYARIEQLLTGKSTDDDRLQD